MNEIISEINIVTAEQRLASGEILKSANDICQNFSQIKNAIEEQSNSAGQIVQTLVILSEINESNTSLPDKLSKLSKSINTETEHLKDIVNRFKMKAG